MKAFIALSLPVAMATQSALSSLNLTLGFSTPPSISLASPFSNWSAQVPPSSPESSHWKVEFNPLAAFLS